MITKLKFADLSLSPIEQMLIDATSEVDAAQESYDLSLDKYSERHAQVELDALRALLFDDKDGKPRIASNDIERRIAQKLMCARDKDLASFRKNMREKRRMLKLWQMREKDYRAIITSRGETE